jgi:endonuclease/exonuclease/phosphatase (EEP) superfamily protein YafD
LADGVTPTAKTIAVSLGRALAWSLAAFAVLATASRWVDVAWSPLVLVQSVSWLAAPVSLLAAAGLLLARGTAARTALAGACGLVLVVQGFIWAPWLTAQEARPGRDLTVMAVNVYRQRADMAAIGRVVRQEGVDVLTLSEAQQATVDRLRAAGVTRRLPYAFPAGPPPEGSLIRSRYPLSGLPDSTGPVTGETALRNPAARLPTRDGVVVRAVHPPPPVPWRIEGWRANLDDLSRWAEQEPGPLVLAGDFNASVDHPGMRALLGSGLRDAHEVVGAGRVRTWPNGRTVPPFVHLDHVLVRGLDVESVRVVRIPGSDHDAVVAHLVIPAG